MDKLTQVICQKTVIKLRRALAGTRLRHNRTRTPSAVANSPLKTEACQINVTV